MHQKIDCGTKVNPGTISQPDETGKAVHKQEN